MSNEAIILATLVGFCTLAFLLLAPIYLFLNREEEASKKWTKQELARRLREREPSSNGHDQKPADEEGEHSAPRKKK